MNKSRFPVYFLLLFLFSFCKDIRQTLSRSLASLLFFSMLTFALLPSMHINMLSVYICLHITSFLSVSIYFFNLLFYVFIFHI